MLEQSSKLIQKLRNYCYVLRDDGMSYGDYPSTELGTVSEQLTTLLQLGLPETYEDRP